MKTNKYFLFAASVCIFSIGGCSSSNSSNANYSSGTGNSFNTGNMATASNTDPTLSEMNSMNMGNANMSFNTAMNKPINSNTLSASLKQRLKQDKEEVLTQKDWEENAWLDLNIGLFYKNDDEFVRDTVCDVTEKILESNNKRMTKVAQRRLRRSIKHDTKCKSAVDEMLNATLDTKPIILTN